MVSRSENMRRIRSKDTVPELFARRLVHGLGYRYRLHRHDLPGRPDMVFPRRKRVIFVHGCFWHQHTNCTDSHIPKSNRNYWRPKLLRNKARDAENRNKLRKIGWRSLVLWECQLKSVGAIVRRVKRFLVQN